MATPGGNGRLLKSAWFARMNQNRTDATKLLRHPFITNTVTAVTTSEVMFRWWWWGTTSAAVINQARNTAAVSPGISSPF